MILSISMWLAKNIKILHVSILVHITARLRHPLLCDFRFRTWVTWIQASMTVDVVISPNVFVRASQFGIIQHHHIPFQHASVVNIIVWHTRQNNWCHHLPLDICFRKIHVMVQLYRSTVASFRFTKNLNWYRDGTTAAQQFEGLSSEQHTRFNLGNLNDIEVADTIPVSAIRERDRLFQPYKKPAAIQYDSETNTILSSSENTQSR